MNADLTKAENNAVNALKRLAKRWPKGIWLYCTGNAMHVMRCGDRGEHVMDRGGSPDQEYIVTSISGIDHDGGDF